MAALWRNLINLSQEIELTQVPRETTDSNVSEEPSLEIKKSSKILLKSKSIKKKQ